MDGIITDLARIICFRMTDNPDNVIRTNLEHGPEVKARFMAYVNASTPELGELLFELASLQIVLGNINI